MPKDGPTSSLASIGASTDGTLMRQSLELQKKTNACLEEIKAELKRR
jgi:hypothetical protein